MKVGKSKGLVAHKIIPFNGEVSVAITRKYSVRPYETVDVFVSVTASAEGQSQEVATKRVFDQLKVDAEKMCKEIKLKCEAGEL